MKRPSYLELGRRQAFGRTARKPVGPVDPPPRPEEAEAFDLGSWHVEPAAGRMRRGAREIALDVQTLQILLILAAAPEAGVGREALAVRVFGVAGSEEHGPKLRRCLGFLRRVFSEDGSVRILNAPGDCYVLEVGEPTAERAAPAPESDVLLENPGAISAWMGRGRRYKLAIAVAGIIVTGIAIGLFFLIDGGRVRLFGTVSRVTPLATEPGDKLSPSFSPDGRQLVYAWRGADGTEKLYVRGVAGGAPRAITRGEGLDSYPVWSPKGDLIAFQRRTGDACIVAVVTPDGGEPRKLNDCDFGGGGPMTWLPDGVALIYAHRTAWYMPSQIVSVAAKDGQMVAVTNPASGMPGDSQPSLAHTGRRLIFARTRAPGVSDLWLIELGGGIPERATKDLKPVQGTAWEPASLSVIAATPRAGRDQLWRIRFDSTPPHLVLALGEDLRSPSLSNDGHALAFERWHIDSRIAQLPNSPDASPATPWRAEAAHERGMQVSADGQRVVFVSNRSGHDQLWVAPAAGGAATQLTRTELDYLETPRWSPDGKYVAYTTAQDGRFDVWVCEVASGQLERITDDGHSRAPSFSRDGKWLYMGSSRGGNWQIWRRPWPGDGKPEQVTTEGGLAAIETPDGNALYYVRADRSGLWIRNRGPGGDDALVTPGLAPLDFRNWNVGADSVWFVTRTVDGPPTLARYLLSEGRIVSTRPVPAVLPDSGVTFAPDGKSVWIAETAKTRVDLEIATIE